MSKQKDQQPDISRRHILRGLASAPVVMTLSNGSHAAATSSTLCIGNAPAELQTAAELNPDITAVDNRWCGSTTGTSIQTVVPPSGEYYNTGPGTALMTPTTNPSGNACVLYVNSDGVPQGHDSTLGNYPVTASCYTSFI